MNESGGNGADFDWGCGQASAKKIYPRQDASGDDWQHYGRKNMQHLLRQLHLRDGSNCHPERREDMKNYVITIAEVLAVAVKKSGKLPKDLGYHVMKKRILKMASEFSG